MVRKRPTHRLVERSSPVHVETLQQLVGDDECLRLGVTGNTDPLAVLLHGLVPVPIPIARVALVQQVTHQLGQKCLKGSQEQTC